MQTPTVNPHPLKGQIKRKRLRLWQIRTMLGGFPSEGTLSKMLSGIIPMPEDVENGLTQIVNE